LSTPERLLHFEDSFCGHLQIIYVVLSCTYMYRINKPQNKTNILLKQDKPLFYTKDLGKLWGLSNSATLNTTISRYVTNGVLVPVYKGLYSTKPLNQVDQILLGSVALHSYSYLSTEFVLAKNGIIFQLVNSYSYCSTKNRTIKINENVFKSRQLQDVFLYNTYGVERINGYQVATTERAIADMMYYNPKYYFDSYDTIDWKKVQKVQKEVGYI